MNPTTKKFVKVKATATSLNNLLFAAVALEKTVIALRAHKHPHLPAIRRAEAASIFIHQIAASTSNVLSNLELLYASSIAEKVSQ